jgi:hypothetical protein
MAAAWWSAIDSKRAAQSFVRLTAAGLFFVVIHHSDHFRRDESQNQSEGYCEDQNLGVLALPPILLLREEQPA